VRKGDPVVITGRLEVDEWTGPDGQQRSGLVINASAVGVDATRGRVEFSRVVHHGGAADGAPGGPADGEELTAARPGDDDPFALDVLAAGGAVDVPDGEDDAGDETDDAGRAPRSAGAGRRSHGQVRATGLPRVAQRVVPLTSAQASRHPLRVSAPIRSTYCERWNTGSG
jgi:single-strand DNA-binding protein